jgi:23S rRNA A1618 N6-methylase RlmF
MAEVLNARLPHVLISNHPNSLPDLHFTDHWTHLVRAYDNPQGQSIIDHDVQHLIHSIRHLQLDRTPIHIHEPLNLPSVQGMSPKKAHEVSRMASYILDLLQTNNAQTSHIRIVDIGAGRACRFPFVYSPHLKMS